MICVERMPLLVARLEEAQKAKTPKATTAKESKTRRRRPQPAIKNEILGRNQNMTDGPQYSDGAPAEIVIWAADPEPQNNMKEQVR
jgi:hypothetical protein